MGSLHWRSQQDNYKQSIESAGLEVLWVRNNDAYDFISKSAKGASIDYGVKSVSLLAQKSKAH
jgi:arsenite methyltransferase